MLEPFPFKMAQPIPPLYIYLRFVLWHDNLSKGGFRRGYRNVSHKQQSFSGLQTQPSSCTFRWISVKPPFHNVLLICIFITTWTINILIISSIFIGSADTCDLSMYLLYLIWSRNASAITQAEHFCSSEKKWRPKAVLHWNKNKMEELLTRSF